MAKPNLTASAKERVKGMVELRDCVRQLIDMQMDEYTLDSAIKEKQGELNQFYDSFAKNMALSMTGPTVWRFPPTVPTTCCAPWRCWTRTGGWNARRICSPSAPSSPTGLLPAWTPPWTLWPCPSGSGPV